MTRTVANAIAESLAAAGISHAFCVPGESYLPLLDAMRDVCDRVRLITCRHEAAAANMAEAAGKLTGKPGVVMVTRGPGATHAAIGLHTAQQDSTPLLLLVGQVGDDMVGREAFQEVDYHRLFGSIAKRVVTLRDPERTTEQMASALSCTMSGRPGPVVVVLPDDRLALPCDAPVMVPTPVTPPAPEPAALVELALLLERAERPLLVLGGPAWRETDCAKAVQVAERLGLPVLTSWRRKDRFDNHHPHYGGELGLGACPALLDAVRRSDLLLVVGARLTENETHGYSLFSGEFAARNLVHVCADPEALGRTWQPRMAVHAATAPTLCALANMAPASRRDWVSHINGIYADWVRPTAVQSGVNLADVMLALSERFGSDAIITSGAGNFASWVHRFTRHRRLGSQLAPISGAMGYGVPTAIAAAILHPDRPVVGISGDGDFLMASQDLATVSHSGCKPLFLVVDNGQYGTIRMHQARDFPGRPSATALTNPDFAVLARSFGLHAETVRTTAEFVPALDRCVGQAALIHILTDPQEISPGRRLESGV